MKLTFRIILAIAILNVSVAFSQDPVSTIPIKKGENENPSGMRMPQNEVSCIYDGQNLYFSFTYPEGDAAVSITDPVAGYMEFDESTLAPFYVNVGPLQSGAQIILFTSDGNSYSGTYY